MAWNHLHLHDHRLKPKTHSGIASPFGQVYIYLQTLDHFSLT